MNSDTILMFLVQSTLLITVALALIALTRRQPALRLAIGRVSLLAVLGLAIVSPYTRERTNPVVPVSYSAIAAPILRIAANPSRILVARKSVSATHSTPSTPSTPSTQPSPSEFAGPALQIDPTPIVLSIWGLGSIVSVLALFAGYLGLARIRRSCRPVTDSETLEIVSEVSAAYAIRPPDVLCGAKVANPFVAGVLRPTVYLPNGWADEQSSETMRAILHHEMAHIAHGDLRWMLFHRLMCIAFWPQLLLWIVKRPMASSAEELCDRCVLAAGIPDHRYADCLLLLREGLRARPCPSLGIGAVSAKSALAKRIEAIFDKNRSRAVRVSRAADNLTRVGAVAVTASAMFLIARPLSQLPPDPTAGWIKSPYSGSLRIQDAQGHDIKGSKAWLMVTGDVPDPLVREQKVIDSVVNFNPGEIPSKQTAGNLLVTAKGYGANFVRLWPNPSKVTSIKLDPPKSIGGQLKYANGKPAAGIVVGVASLSRLQAKYGLSGFISDGPTLMHQFTARTNEQGQFVIGGLPAATHARLDVEDSRFARLSEEARAITPVNASKDKVSKLATPEILQSAARVTGRVTRHGQPVAGVRVDAQGNFNLDSNDIGNGGTAHTDSNGNYTIDRLCAGPLNISLTLNGPLEESVTAVAHEGVRVKAGSTVSGIDFTLIPGSILEGSVTDGAGKPVAELYIGVYGPAHPQSSPEVQMMLTKSDGSFRFHVPAGKQHVYIGDSRYEQSQADITTVDGQTEKVNFVAKPAQQRDPIEMADDTVAPTIKEVDDSKPTGSVASYGPGKPFYGPKHLANGAVVSLEYVQNDASKAHTLWKPDGSKANPTDIKESLNMDGFSKRKNSSVRSMFLKVNIAGLNRGDYTCLVQTPHLSNWSVWQSYGDGENRTMDLASFHAASTLKVTDMKFGVGAGPYKTVMTAKLGKGPLMAEAMDGRTRPPAVLQGEASFQVTIRFPQQYEGSDARVEVFAKDGTKLDLASWQTDSVVTSAGKRTRTYGFTKGKAEDVDHVALVVRPYEWVTFKGIHLYPNAK